MKTLLYIFAVIGFVQNGLGQKVSLIFNAADGISTIDSIRVNKPDSENLATIIGTNTFNLNSLTSSSLEKTMVPFKSLWVYPNPCQERTNLRYVSQKRENIEIAVYSLIGNKLSALELKVDKGVHGFEIAIGPEGAYLVNVCSDGNSYTEKIVCRSKGNRDVKIEYQGKINEVVSNKSANAEPLNSYHFEIYSGEKTTIIVDSPSTSKIYSVEFFKCKDADGNNYKIVQIGNQWWMAENLRTTRYSDGISIQNVTDDAEWGVLSSGAYCWYNNDGGYRETYGALYNGHALETNLLAPEGWHVPTEEEWTVLSDYLGGERVAGGKMKEAGITHWKAPNAGATNESGFTGLPGGSRNPGWGDIDNPLGGGNFVNMGEAGAWFVSIPYDGYFVDRRYLTSNIEWILSSDPYSKTGGFSIRCAKD